MQSTRLLQAITILGVLFLLLGLMSADGCSGENTTDTSQTQATERMLSEANRQVGMPNITNFTERKLAKSILELRDSEGLRTWTYIVDLNGELHFLTESIGYGLPYSVQFTNPQRPYHRYSNSGAASFALPQPDPNGLFMPEGLSATWILAATEDGPKPLYVEPEIVVSPFPLLGTEEVQ